MLCFVRPGAGCIYVTGIITMKNKTFVGAPFIAPADYINSLHHIVWIWNYTQTSIPINLYNHIGLSGAINGAPTKLISNVYAYPVYVSKNRYIARGVWEAAPYTVVIYTYLNLRILVEF